MRISRLLMPAVTLAGALALAGCGGGSGTTAEEEGDECTYGKKDNGDCYTLAERDAKRDAERDKKAEEEKKAEEMSEAAQARAKALHGFLADTTNPVVSPTPMRGSTFVTAGDLQDAYETAVEKGTGSKMKASVVVANTKGGDVESIDHRAVDDDGTAEAPPGNAILTNGDNAEHIQGSGFANTEGVTVKHTDVQGEGTRKVRGSYKGAMGEFECASGNDCTSQKTNKGIKLGGAGWAFTPDTGQKYKLDDPRYAEFGWWLNEAASGAPKVGAWYGDGAASDGDAFAAVSTTASTGSATYTGSAIGQAAFHDATTPAENIGGAFTADAKLTANFDGGTDGMLKGDLTNFKVGGVDVGWSVELIEKSVGSGAVALGTGSHTKWTVNENTAAASGNWTAAFYDLPDGEHQPKGVAGGFISHHGDEGRMVGAFGAER